MNQETENNRKQPTQEQASLEAGNIPKTPATKDMSHDLVPQQGQVKNNDKDPGAGDRSLANEAGEKA